MVRTRLRLSPDGKRIFVIAGNHTMPPFNPGEELTSKDYTSRVPTNWGEDHLLPRMWDAERSCRRDSGTRRLDRQHRSRRQDMGHLQHWLPQSVRHGVQRRWRTVRLRRRHGMGRRHAVVPANASGPCHQRQRIRLAQRQRQMAQSLSSTACRRWSTSAPVRRWELNSAMA